MKSTELEWRLDTTQIRKVANPIPRKPQEKIEGREMVGKTDYGYNAFELGIESCLLSVKGHGLVRKCTLRVLLV